MTPEFYQTIKSEVVEAGYLNDITWADSLKLERISEGKFLAETAHVILCSGFRASTVEARWDKFSAAFMWWDSAKTIMEHRRWCREKALEVFANRAKIDAIIGVIKTVFDEGWFKIRSEITEPLYLTRFKFIGRITCYHLARNIGFDCVKPDRHLVRIAAADGHENPLSMCRELSNRTGDRLGVIDAVLWRWATIESDYLKRVRQSK